MSHPRRVFGPNPPGRLAAAMLRALTAELADPGRYARAKAYARDANVIDVEVEAGVVRGQVQGSRYDPYVAMLYVAPVDADDVEAASGSAVSTALLIPSRHDLATSCSCPDGDTSGTAVCKHALATLLVLADEVTIEPELLLRWRSGVRLDRPARVVESVAPIDVLAGRLHCRAELPALPDLAPMIVRPAVVDDFSEVLASALDALTITS